MGPVDRLAQVAPAAVLQEGPEAGHVEPQRQGPSAGLAPSIAGLPGGLGQQLPQAVGQALHARPRSVSCRVQALVASSTWLPKLVASSASSWLAALKASWASGPPAPRRAVPCRGAPPPGCAAGWHRGRPVPAGERRASNSRQALAGPVAEGHHRRLLVLVGLPQLGAVADPVEVAHHPPAPAQPLPQPLQRIHHLRPRSGGRSVVASRCSRSPPGRRARPPAAPAARACAVST